MNNMFWNKSRMNFVINVCLNVIAYDFPSGNANISECYFTFPLGNGKHFGEGTFLQY